MNLTGCGLASAWLLDARIQSARLAGRNSTYFELVSERIREFPDDPKTLSVVRSAARIAHLEAKDYPRAIDYNRFLILRSPDSLERRNSQMYTAQIYFENLQDFERATIEYEKLLKLELTPIERFRFRLNVARSQFQLSDHAQALQELNAISLTGLDDDSRFEVLRLKGNVLMAKKDLHEATGLWESLLKDFPERATKENIGMNLVFCYEESKNFLKAVDVLEGMKTQYPNPEFLNMKIERLKERHDNLPGARGWKR